MRVKLLKSDFLNQELALPDQPETGAELGNPNHPHWAQP